MKKFLMLYGSLLLAGLLILAGCPADDDVIESVSSDNSSSAADFGPAGTGVLGQVSGVVYNSVTAQPIKGVSVELGGKVTVKTDKNGGFLFRNVKPGTYTVSFYLEGFQFRTKNVVVDAQEYIKDDPFLEAQALKEQFVALHDWVNKQKVTIPDYTGFGGSDLNWTYQDGVYIDGNNAAVTIKNEGGEFVIKPYKLTNYTYSKGIPLYITSLAPLTGAIQTSIKLFTNSYSAVSTLNEKLDEPIDIDDGVEFWLVESGFTNNPDNILGWGLGTVPGGGTGQQPEYDLTVPNTAFQEAKGGAVFGPATTKNGVLLFTGLPVDIPLDLVNNGFVKKDTSYFYKLNTTPYQYAESANGFKDVNGTAPTYTDTIFIAKNNSGNGKNQNYTNVGPVYLFPEGSFAIITDTDTGTPVASKRTTDKISLTFSEPIDTSTFAAILQLTTNASTYNTTPGANNSIPLANEWVDETTVKLSPAIASAETGGLMPNFPRSKDGTLNIGTLTINGRAQSGAKILAVTSGNTGIPVFTEEGIKLIGVDINASYERVIVSASAIKLVFNKEVNGDSSRFWLGTGTYEQGKPVEFYLSADQKSVFIKTNLLTATLQTLRYTVVSASDPNDSKTDSVSEDFQNTNDDKARLVLKGTNIYENGYVSANGVNANFPIAGAITLNFDKAIPYTTANDIKDFVKVSLSRGTSTNATSGNSISLSKSVSGNTLTITPTVPLVYGSDYYLDVLIGENSKPYFKTSDLVNLTLVAITTTGNINILFRTVVDPAYKPTVSALSGATSATSSELTVSGNAVTSGTLKAGTPYYVQFDGELSFTAPADLTATDDFSSGELSFTLQKVGTDILKITVVADPAATNTTWTGVALTTPIGATYSNGTINTSSGTFTISGLTVNK